MQDINIVVLGAPGSGKSSFIRRTLDYPNPSISQILSRKMTIDGSNYIVRFLELTFDDVPIGENNNIKWPDTVGDLATPRIDGAVVIYDVTSQESLAKVPEMLS